MTSTAILKLRDADNAVIRNNRFIAKGLFVSCPAAINLINSRSVQIENNTVEGGDSLVRKDEVSSASDKGNALK